MTPALLPDLQRRLKALEADLGRRVVEVPEYAATLSEEHEAAVEAGRTAEAFETWRAAQVTQAAVAWLLTTVFVRFCEDNRLLGRVWLAGPGERLAEAADAQEEFFTSGRGVTDRDWLDDAVDHLAALPATQDLVDEHNPLTRLAPDAEACADLIRFWRRRDGAGALVHDFTDPALNTRFLGDLYQELSAEAKSRYALLQTPEFVEQFILDRAFEPGLAQAGTVRGFRMIDPTCGSGHFLLGAFRRLLARWTEEAPGLPARERVQGALDGVHGVDKNPYAVAVARFRLLVAALEAEGLTSLEAAPDYRLHLATGDSLLHGPERALPGMELEREVGGFTYETEDLDRLQELLAPGQYDVVVGNPPYITPKDKAENEAYRARYSACRGKYALTVPFAQQFHLLARRHETRPGWVGQITSNSFMKREFGRDLVEQFLPTVDLREVVDTSGAYIPGHGTPTVILVSRRTRPEGAPVRAVLGVRGEPGAPVNPAQGLVWREIVDAVEKPDYAGEYVTSADLERSRLATHPWSLSGGGASHVLAVLDRAPGRLSGGVESIGFAAVSGEDGAYLDAARSVEAPTRLYVEGDVVRDWENRVDTEAVYPYDSEGRPLAGLKATWHFWRLRAPLRAGLVFGKTKEQRGMAWFEYTMPHRARLLAQHLIAFAFVATHNHFVLDRGGKVFNRSAPVIKLPEGASEEEHLGLLGLLNSSTACFWLKQVSHSKGNATASSGMPDQPWSWNWEFTGTKLSEFPLPERRPLSRAQKLDDLAQRLAAVTPSAVATRETPTREALDAARAEAERLRAEMVAVQEELDWEVYRLYGLVEEDLTYSGDDLPGLALGERAFEVRLARQVAAGLETTRWFERHRSTSVTVLPEHWPAEYRALVQRRLDLVESDPHLALVERPECKRRWASEPWEKAEQAALAGWLLDRLEEPSLWRDRAGRPRTRSVADLAEELTSDADVVAVAGLRAGRADSPLQPALTSLLADQAVPFLAAHRHTDSGLEKRAVWERTWAEQRREDAGEDVGTIPVPPKYAQKDFRGPAAWKHRGALDVPKERFVAYPGATRDADGSPLLGWAGWDHLQQAVALLTVLVERADADVWGVDRLEPLLAGLVELEPWLHQWHADPDPAYGGSPAAYVSAQVDAQLARWERTRDQVRAWRPPAARRGRPPKG